MLPKVKIPRIKIPAKPKTFPTPVARPRYYCPPQSIYKNVNVIIEANDQSGALYLGDFTAAMEKNNLKNKGIKTVLTVAIGMNIHYAPNTINHHVYPAFDIESFDLSIYFEETYEVIKNGLKNGSVLVHCACLEVHPLL